jgi:hypothetical protein
MLEQAVRIHNEITHPELSSPLDYLAKEFAEVSGFLDKLGFSLTPPEL